MIKQSKSVSFNNFTEYFKTKSNNIINFLVPSLIIFAGIGFLNLANVGLLGGKNLLTIILAGSVGVVGLLLWLISEKTESVAYNRFSIALAFYFAVLFASLLNSPNFNVSFFGYGLSPNSVLALVSVGVVGFLAFFLATKKNSFIYILGSMYLVYLVSLLHILVFWISKGGWPGLSIFNSNFSNLIGSWNDFLIFNGLILLISILSLFFIKKNFKLKSLLYIASVLSGLFLIISGNVFIIVLLTFVLFGIFIYSVLHYYSSHDNENRDLTRLPLIPFVAFLIGVLAIFISPFINNLVSNSLIDLRFSEVRLGFLPTISVLEQSLRADFLTGLGPNTFELAWQKWRPSNFITNNFSDLPLQFGYSWFLTQISNLGILGLVSILIIFGIFIDAVFRQFKKPIQGAKDYYGIIFAFLGILLWMVIFLNTLNYFLLLLTFIISGLLIGLNEKSKLLESEKVVIEKNANNSKLPLWHSVLMSVLLGIVFLTLISGIFYALRIAKAENVLSQISSQNDDSENLAILERATNLANQDRYYRVLAQTKFEILLQDLGDIDSQSGPDQEQRQLIVDRLDSILEDLQKAVSYNNTNYLNFLALGDTFFTLARLGFDDALDKADSYYRQAQFSYPSSLEINVRLAQIAFIKQDESLAESLLIDNLRLRPQHLDSLLLLATIYREQEKPEQALAALSQAANLNPASLPAFLALADEYERQQMIEEASIVYEQILVTYPGIEEIRNRLIEIYQLQERQDLAKVHIDYLSKDQ